MGNTYSTGALLIAVAATITLTGLAGFTLITLWRIARRLRRP